MAKRGKRIVIVGGGASGVLLACHLLRDDPSDISVTLIEKRASIGRGVAYSTAETHHVLNVRAANMSAFADDPRHFCRWLADNDAATDGAEPDPLSFVTRSLYGSYINSLVAPLLEGGGGLEIVHASARALDVSPAGVAVETVDGRIFTGDLGVLATGHDEATKGGPTCYVNPWESPAAAKVPQSAAVLISGTGLTMVDYVLSLRNSGHMGPIYAISRRGLIPQTHRPVVPLKLEADDIPLGRGLIVLWRWLRTLARSAAAEGGDWRSAVDGIRPYSWNIWRSLSAEDKHRFLRHARAWWEVHRHRMAPEIEEKIKASLKAGQLRVLAAKVIAIEPSPEGALVTYRRRGHAALEKLKVAKIVQCTGVYSDPRETTNVVLKGMLRAGLARADPLGIGLDVSAECAVLGRDGQASEVLFAVGPLTRAAFWEIMAVPDIRVQCAGLASHLRARLAGLDAGEAQSRVSPVSL